MAREELRGHLPLQVCRLGSGAVLRLGSGGAGSMSPHAAPHPANLGHPGAEAGWKAGLSKVPKPRSLLDLEGGTETRPRPASIPMLAPSQDDSPATCSLR